jgi:hypothetical protein
MLHWCRSSPFPRLRNVTRFRPTPDVEPAPNESVYVNRFPKPITWRDQRHSQGGGTVVTFRDVAKHAGVSPATVSRVVNGLVGSDETRERVENAVKSLSYETDYLARGLKTRQTSVIG